MSLLGKVIEMTVEFGKTVVETLGEGFDMVVRYVTETVGSISGNDDQQVENVNVRARRRQNHAEHRTPLHDTDKSNRYRSVDERMERHLQNEQRKTQEALEAWIKEQDARRLLRESTTAFPCVGRVFESVEYRQNEHASGVEGTVDQDASREEYRGSFDVDNTPLPTTSTRKRRIENLEELEQFVDDDVEMLDPNDHVTGYDAIHPPQKRLRPEQVGCVRIPPFATSSFTGESRFEMQRRQHRWRQNRKHATTVNSRSQCLSAIESAFNPITKTRKRQREDEVINGRSDYGNDVAHRAGKRSRPDHVECVRVPPFSITPFTGESRFDLQRRQHQWQRHRNHATTVHSMSHCLSAIENAFNPVRKTRKRQREDDDINNMEVMRLPKYPKIGEQHLSLMDVDERVSVTHTTQSQQSMHHFFFGGASTSRMDIDKEFDEMSVDEGEVF